MKKLIHCLLAFVVLLASSYSFATQKVTVFAAASLTNALEEIKTLYQPTHPEQEVVLSFASSSVLARQIEQGAPADIFISADQKWMDYLLDRKLANSKETLLQNALVLIVPKSSPIGHVSINRNTDWSAILPSPEKIAVGDPDHVPAGIYAKESLTNLGVFNKLEPQLARASNVRDALMLVERNEAVLGIVYSTDAKISTKVKTVGEFPADSFKPIEYPISLLDNSGQDFYQFLKSAPAKAVFIKYGFVIFPKTSVNSF
ncbi:molybdate ABC transporter substrate-binding protein [Orbaceae bacterium ac157xtp]